MNKSGFSCTLLHAVSSRILFYSYLHFSLFFCFIFLCSSPSLYPGSLRIFSFFFPCTHAQLEPLTFCIPLPYQFLFYTTALQSSVDNFLIKNNFYFTSHLPKFTLQLNYSSVESIFHTARKHTSHAFITSSLVNIKGCFIFLSPSHRVPESLVFFPELVCLT